MDKKYFLSTGWFYDNDYLELYIDLINNNLIRGSIHRETQSHHIIPRSYYRYYQLAINNAPDNIVNFLFKDHILAHYYLSMCTIEMTLVRANLAAICLMTNNDKLTNDVTSYEWIAENLTEIQNQYEKVRQQVPNVMFNPKVKEKHDNSMRKEETRQKISTTMKKLSGEGSRFSKETREKISQHSVGKIYMHLDNKVIKIYPQDKEKYLALGYELGRGIPLSEEHKQALINSHLGKHYSEELKQKLSDAHKGQVPINKGVPCSEERKNRISQSLQGRKWVTNGEVQKLVKSEDAEFYLSQGYQFGQKRDFNKGGDLK